VNETPLLGGPLDVRPERCLLSQCVSAVLSLLLPMRFDGERRWDKAFPAATSLRADFALTLAQVIADHSHPAVHNGRMKRNPIPAAQDSLPFLVPPTPPTLWKSLFCPLNFS
jgi:hypothetical protein